MLPLGCMQYLLKRAPRNSIFDKLMIVAVHTHVKNEVLEHGIVKNNTAELILVAQDDAVNAFRITVQGQMIDLVISSDGVLKDEKSGTIWDARGKYKTGIIDSDLQIVTISDEYWYSWKLFHPRSELIRI